MISYEGIVVDPSKMESILSESITKKYIRLGTLWV